MPSPVASVSSVSPDARGQTLTSELTPGFTVLQHPLPCATQHEAEQKFYICGFGESGSYGQTVGSIRTTRTWPRDIIHLRGGNSSQFPDTRPEVTVNSPVSNAGSPGMALQKH